MTSFFLREAPAAKEITGTNLASVIDCSVCHGFVKRNLIQLYELAKSCQTCPGCYFLQGILVVLDRAGFNIPTGAWTPFLLTSWTLWGTEHFLTISRCQRRPFVNWQVPTILEEADFIEVFKTPGEKCPWTKIPTAKLISGYTGSQACINLLQSRLEECMQKHSLCKTSSSVILPSRVVHISATENGALVVRLLETNNAVGKYVCLSHRWIEGQTITTTTSNIEERRAGIPWNDLPKTFREAITVSHKLGFEYIWIDSLAINQDQSSGDWLLEAPKMAQYYQNSSLTVSAAEATEGLFYRLPDTTQVGWKVMPPKHFNQTSYNIFVRKPLDHDTSALHHRGWVFQEHILSPRIAHFGKELIWECAELTACECGRLPLPTKGGQAPLRDMWDIGNVVSTYGRKQGHAMALSSSYLQSGYSLIPQPVFVRPDPSSTRAGVVISHWLLMQKQFGKDRTFVDSPANVSAMMAGSQSQDDVGGLADSLVLLQTGGVHHGVRKEKDTNTLLGITDGSELSQREPAKSSRPESSENPKEDIVVYPPTTLTHSRWLDIVAHYTRRKLTFGSDILPALAGLAKQFHLIFNCDYYAGLWEDTLPIDLLWRSHYPENHPKPTEWRAPSWSWASTTAAVDYYHLLMAFELDSHTFRYSISHFFIDDIKVECVPRDGNDMTMRLKSAKVTLVGAIFELVLGPAEDKSGEQNDEYSKMTAKDIESMRSKMEQAIQLPSKTTPEDDIRYFPLSRCMDKVQEISWLAHDTGLMFVSKRNKTREVRHALDIWWDHKEDADAGVAGAGKTGVFKSLVVARHESTLDTAFFCLLLRPTDEPGTYERIGLMRLESIPDVSNPTIITII